MEVAGYEVSKDRLAKIDEALDRAFEETKRNHGFVQVYRKGWWKMRELADISIPAFKLFTLLAQNLGDNGAVCASQETLATMLGQTVRTVRRHIRTLEDADVIVRIRVGNGCHAYCLNPEQVWNSWDSLKDGAAFNTRVLVDRKATQYGTRRLKFLAAVGDPLSMPADIDQPDLFEDMP